MSIERVDLEAESAEGSCPSCGYPALTQDVATSKFAFATGSGVVELEATHCIEVCPRCGAEFAGEDAEDRRHEAVCDYLGVLRPRDIRQLRSTYGLDRKEFAALTGLGEASIGRWESGAQIQQASSDRFLRLIAQPANVSLLQQLSDGDREIGRLAPVSMVSEPRALRNVELARQRGAAFRLRLDLGTAKAATA